MDVLPFNPYQRAESIIKDEKNNKDTTEVIKHLNAEKDKIDNGIGILDAEEFLASNDRELVKQKDVKGSHSGWWEQDDVRISDVIKSDSKPKDVEISVIRKGSPKPLKFKLERRTFTVESVTSNVLEADNLGYIKLNCIAKTTGDELQKALSSLKQKNVKGLILDMRDLAGGSVESAIAVAKPFLGTNRIMTTVLHSHGKQTAIHMPSVPTEDRWDAPIIVLVNNGTASMAEVIAAALKENLSAKLVGEKTYGDFTETTVIDQKDGSAIVMTTGAFLTSKGGNYNGKGLPVDVVVASTASGDPQLKEAARLLAGGGIKD